MGARLLGGNVIGLLIDGHVYVQRASKDGELVWIGKAGDFEKLEPRAAYNLLSYRLAWDARCCQRVH